jgi:hypothetical protein
MPHEQQPWQQQQQQKEQLRPWQQSQQQQEQLRPWQQQQQQQKRLCSFIAGFIGTFFVLFLTFCHLPVH